MMYFVFSLIALFAWSGSDLFSKMASDQKDKNSQWKVMFGVGLIMGIHAVLTLVISPFMDVDSTPQWLLSIFYTDFKPIDLLHYFPIAAVYLIAMLIGYVGLRYIELSVSSPICNSSGSLALIICILLGWAKLDLWTGIGVVLITFGIIFLSFVEYKEDDEVKALRQEKCKNKYTKSFIAILIPIIYLVVDALGTVGDQLISELELFELSEYASNTAFEFTSVVFALLSFLYVVVIKKEKFFKVSDSDSSMGFNKYYIFGGVCETIGQMFYMAVMFSDFDVGMPMISAYCAVSAVWSRIILKEKLSFKHYLAIVITFIGIVLLGIFSSI